MPYHRLLVFALAVIACSSPLPGHAQTKSVSWQEVKPILDGRCVVCHSCYDAPCQVQLSSPEGADRGASKAVVYQGDRLEAAKPTRLFIDEKSTEDWRRRDFYSVLRTTDPDTERASLMIRMLALAHAHPLPANQKLPASVDLSLDRALSCPEDSEFDEYAKSHPYGGMPYGLAPLNQREYETLLAWLTARAPLPTNAPSISDDAKSAIAKWEAFLNGVSVKEQLMARYLYEHLFLAHLHFPGAEARSFFRLVRSKTPSGQRVDEIATVRPYDSPGDGHFYYRLQPVTTTIVDKTHMPYSFGAERMWHYKKIFLDTDWTLDHMPSYDPKDSANPFVTFAAIPARTRYEFLLDEAHYFISTFIKGPVCRGQIALDVIEDHFFVAFLDPDSDLSVTDNAFLDGAKKYLDLPAENKSRYRFGALWIKYLVKWREYVDYRAKRYRKADPDKRGPSLDDIWDGDGTDDNALLTVFRHFDSATVVKGFVGEIPKTAWVVDYPVLERIYYDLVAGFNVFGNVTHQLSTRLYMDYLRMESEDLFLSFLPADARESTRDLWYAGAAAQAKAFIENRLTNLDVGTRVPFTTSNPKRELLERIEAKMTPAVRGAPDPMNRCTEPPCGRTGVSAIEARVDSYLHVLAAERAEFVRFMPDLSLLRVHTGYGDDLAYTLIRNKAHRNVAFMFFEDARREPEKDTLTIVPGHLGSYPNFYFEVPLESIDDFVSHIGQVHDDASFETFVDAYGVRRSSPEFWSTADWHTERAIRANPIAAGSFDLNRYDDD